MLHNTAYTTNLLQHEFKNVGKIWSSRVPIPYSRRVYRILHKVHLAEVILIVLCVWLAKPNTYMQHWQTHTYR